MTKRLLIGVLIGLGVANVLVVGAWVFRAALQDAGVLPALDLPSRVQLSERPLPAIGASTATEPVDDELDAAGEQPGDVAVAPGPGMADPAPAPNQANPAQPPPANAPSPPAGDATADEPAAGQAPSSITAGGDDGEANAPTPAAGTAAAPPPAETVRCVVAGAFDTRELAVQARGRLAAGGTEARVLVDSVAGDPHYLVYVAPAGSREVAEDVVRALRAEGVDSYVIPSGERAGGVSVGLFKSQQRAKAQQTNVAALGHDVRTTVRNRERLVYRVRATDIPLAALAELPHRPCESATAPQ